MNKNNIKSYDWYESNTLQPDLDGAFICVRQPPSSIQVEADAVFAVVDMLETRADAQAIAVRSVLLLPRECEVGDEEKHKLPLFEYCYLHLYNGQISPQGTRCIVNKHKNQNKNPTYPNRRYSSLPGKH